MIHSAHSSWSSERFLFWDLSHPEADHSELSSKHSSFPLQAWKQRWHWGIWHVIGGQAALHEARSMLKAAEAGGYCVMWRSFFPRYLLCISVSFSLWRKWGTAVIILIEAKDLLRHEYVFDFAKPSTKPWVVGVSWGIASSHSCSRGAPGRGFLANE